MTTSTRTRPRSRKKSAPASSPTPVPLVPAIDSQELLRHRVQYIEAFLGSRLDADSFQEWQQAIAAGSIPSVTAIVAAYRLEYVDTLDGDANTILLLEAFVDAVQKGEAAVLTDYVESFLNGDGGQPRLEVLRTCQALRGPWDDTPSSPAAAVRTARTPRVREPTADTLAPPRHGPLPGQGQFFPPEAEVIAMLDLPPSETG
jgi:hypothetical protein